MASCLMDIWAEVQPSVCKSNSKGYSLRFEDYMPVLVAETATGMSAVLGAAIYLTHRMGANEQLSQLAKSAAGDLEHEATLAVRRYLYALKGEWLGDMQLFEGSYD